MAHPGITQADLDNWFVYHPPQDGDHERYQRIRDAAKAFAEVLVAEAPQGPDLTAAIRKVREAVTTANQAIACTPRSSSDDESLRNETGRCPACGSSSRAYRLQVMSETATDDGRCRAIWHGDAR